MTGQTIGSNWALLFFAFQLYSIMKGVKAMKKFLKVCGIILGAAICIELFPLLILVLVIAFVCAKGDTAKDKANRIMDKTKKIINC